MNTSILLSFLPPKKRGYVLMGVAIAALLWQYYSPEISFQEKVQQWIQNSRPTHVTVSRSTSPTGTDSQVVLGQTNTSLDSVPQDAEKVIIQKVVDGDTVDVIMPDNTNETIRLIGINSPESVDPRRPVECFGKEASQKAKELMKKGDVVYLKADSTQDNRDKYDRLLRYIWLNNGQSVNLGMIAQGYAYEYTYDKVYTYQKEFKQAQASAEKTKAGLWSDTTCKGVK